MAITRTDIVGTKIICEIESSNLVKTEYDSETNMLQDNTNTKKWKKQNNLCIYRYGK